MRVQINQNPNKQEVENLFQRAFSEINSDSSGYFVGDLNQDKLSDWFDITEMFHNLQYGSFIEVRDEESSTLLGACFVSKQNPMFWPDGHKAELVIIGVMPEHAKQGIGSMLLEKAEEVAKSFGALSLIVNAHAMQPKVHSFYLKNGYQNIGKLTGYYANGDALFFAKNLVTK